MQCFVHAEAGEQKEAVAVCALCGMGLCAEHALRREAPVLRPVVGVVSPERATWMQILCPTCAEALAQRS